MNAIKGLILAAILLPLNGYANSDLQEKFEKDIVSSDIRSAKADYTALTQDNSIFSKPTQLYLQDCQYAIDFLVGADSFTKTVTKYDPNTVTQQDLDAIDQAYEPAREAINGLTRNALYFEQPTVDSLNTQMSSIQTKYNDFVNAANAALEKKQKDAALAEQQKEQAEEAQREADEQKQEEADKLQEQREASAEKAAARKHKEQVAALDKFAKSKGYKGIYSGGIARFVFTKQRQGGIEKDTNYVFWRDISEDDKHKDSEFTMENIVSGYGIYTLSSCCDARGQYVTMTIAVPATKSAINGQTLTDEYYVFVGNQTFDTVTGTQMNIPVFKPINLDK